MEYIKGTQTRYGQSGNIGGIPPEYVQQKYESTCLFSNEDVLDQHFRDTLKNNTVVPPSLESDQPRYYHGADNLLNVLHGGKRSKIEPSHPEIYIANTTRDERGSNVAPNMAIYREGMNYRLDRYKDLTSDAVTDQSVVEGTWSTPAVNAAKRSTWHDFKKRATWFDTSLSAQYNGALKQQTTTSRMHYIKREDNEYDSTRIITETPSTLFTPSQVIFDARNEKHIAGRRRVPTHRFTRAKYGRAPKSHRTGYDWRENITKTEQTMDFKKSEQNSLRKLAVILSAENSKNKYTNSDTTTNFDTSAEAMTNRHVGKHGNVRIAMNNNTNDQDLMEQMVVDLECKSNRIKQIGDLKKQRMASYFDEDTLDDATMNSHVTIKAIEDPFADAMRRRMGIAEMDHDDSSMTQVYSVSHVPTVEQIAKARYNGLVEYDTNESREIYRGMTGKKVRNVKNVVNDSRLENEVDFIDRRVSERLIGPMGIKSRVRGMMRFEPTKGLGSISSKHSS